MRDHFFWWLSMLRPLNKQRSFFLTLVVGFWLTATGCGQTGPLIYPPESAPANEAAAPAEGESQPDSTE